MAHVKFSEEDAFALMAILRDRVRSSGFAFVDDSALRFANADLVDAPNVPERRRLLFYVDYVNVYFERNSQLAYRSALADVNERLDPESERIRGVQLQVPESTGIYSAHEPLALERVLGQPADRCLNRKSMARWYCDQAAISGLTLSGRL